MSRKLAAEFVGTFWLVFGGCGSAVVAAAFPQLASDSSASLSHSDLPF
jgi:glycerol uptake facilitator-like aquaporin